MTGHFDGGSRGADAATRESFTGVSDDAMAAMAMAAMTQELDQMKLSLQAEVGERE